MFLSSIFSIGQLSCPMLAGFCLSVIFEECGCRWAGVQYIAASLLSLFCLPEKETAFFYVCVFGFYSFARHIMNKINNKFLRVIAKTAAINFSVTVCYFFEILFFIDMKELTINGYFLICLFYLLGNTILFLYEYSINAVLIRYRHQFRAKIIKIFDK